MDELERGKTACEKKADRMEGFCMCPMRRLAPEECMMISHFEQGERVIMIAA